MPGLENEEAGQGWSDYRRFVVAELRNLREETKDAREAAQKVESAMSAQFGSLRNDLQALTSSTRLESTGMKVQIAMLQVKSGVWGLCGGLVPVATALLVAWATGKL